jgi:thioredoxin 1
MSKIVCSVGAMMALFILSSCGSSSALRNPLAQAADSSSGHKKTINGEPMLIGDITRDELFSEFGIFKANYEAYTPNDSILQRLKVFQGKVRVDIFLATWCGDSKRNVPKFLRTVDAADRQNIRLVLIALDRTKRDKQGRAEKADIVRVPTMIVYRDDKEIGRIVEQPKTTIEQDLLLILQQ